MVSVRKRGKVYEYRFETASIDGTRKWISKSYSLSQITSQMLQELINSIFVEKNLSKWYLKT